MPCESAVKIVGGGFVEGDVDARVRKSAQAGVRRLVCVGVGGVVKINAARPHHDPTDESDKLSPPHGVRQKRKKKKSVY